MKTLIQCPTALATARSDTDDLIPGTCKVESYRVGQEDNGAVWGEEEVEWCRCVTM
jgi:hypothetical protein